MVRKGEIACISLVHQNVALCGNGLMIICTLPYEGVSAKLFLHAYICIGT